MTESDFSHWLANNTSLSEASIHHYVGGIRAVSKEMLAADVIEKPLFEMNQIEYEIAVLKILGNPDFKKKDKTGNSMYSNSLRHLQSCMKELSDNIADETFAEKVISESAENIRASSQEVDTISIPLPRNRIIFGAPGTGKSHLLEQQRKNHFNDEHYERVTFHPNYSYSQFVGAYKPVAKTVDGMNDITYAFVPGPFVRVLAKAIKNPSENFLLVIEEINCANVAAVFGDVFQLLDRDESGKSEYPIDASEDLKKYLAESGVPLEDGKIAIPANMYIWATMNSADQGVMPLDAAFKRRWEFEYIGIDENENQVEPYEIPSAKNPDGSFAFVHWNDFRKALNKKLKNLPGASVNEDKLLGPFFISKHSLETAKENAENFIRLFKSKVLMYLYEDVCKMNPRALFNGIPEGGRLHYSDVCAGFDEKGLEIFGADFLEKLDD